MQTKPKIFISTYDDLKNPYYGGGGAVAIHEVFKRLKENFEISIITGSYPHAKDEVVEGLTYRRIGIYRLGPQIGQLIFHLLLPFYVITQHYDLWVESFTPPISTSFLQLFTVKPVIGLVHMLSGRDMFRKYKIPFHFIEWLGIKTYRYFIVVSEMSQQVITRMNKTASFLLAPNGVTLPSGITKYSDKREKYFIFLGRIEINQKGLDLLLEALNLIKGQIDINLKIAGGGDRREVDNLARLIALKKLQNRVELLGRVNDQQKKDLLQHTLFAVIPSRYETFSLSALEILSYGIPLITFDIDGLRWIPGNCVYKVPDTDASTLAKSIAYTYQQPQLRYSLSENALRLAKEYSWDRTSEQYRDFLIKILETQVYARKSIQPV